MHRIFKYLYGPNTHRRLTMRQSAADFCTLPLWVCLSSPGCPSVSSPLSLCRLCCSARLYRPPSSPSLSPSAPAECLWVVLSEKTPSDCDSPADSGGKAKGSIRKICCCCVYVCVCVCVGVCAFCPSVFSFKSSLMPIAHLHHVLVFLQGCGEIGDLLAQGGVVSFSVLQRGCQLSPALCQPLNQSQSQREPVGVRQVLLHLLTCLIWGQRDWGLQNRLLIQR